MKMTNDQLPMTKKGRIILFIIIAMIVLTGCGQKEEKQLQTVSVTKGTIKAQIPTTGTVMPRNRLEIKPPLAGRIDEVLVSEGEIVKKGKTLALMSSSDRAALLDAARAKGEKEYKKWESVYRPAPIIAPIDGFIIQKNIEPGQTVTMQDAVLVMADKLIVKAQVDETDIGRISINQPVNIELDAYQGQAVKGKVEHIAYESQVINNVTIYTVDILPAEIPSYFRSGMSATINFVQQEKNDALLLPLNAVKKIRTQSYVFQMDKTTNKPKSVAIKTGLENTTHLEVVSGLNEGDKVLIPDKKMISDLETKTSRQQQHGPVNPFQRRN